MLDQPYFPQNEIPPAAVVLKAAWHVNANNTYNVTHSGNDFRTLIAVRTKNGSGIVITQNNLLVLTENTLVFIPKCAIRQYYTQGTEWEFYWFEFESTHRISFFEKVLDMDITETESFYILECLKYFIQARMEHTQYGISVFHCLLSYWLLNSTSASSEKETLFLQILSDINARLDKNLCIEELAKTYHLSDRTLRNLFYSQMKKSPLQYIRSSRLATAKYLLECTDMQINEISEQVGYSNQFYFSRDFKGTYGSSPQQYRNKQESK